MTQEKKVIETANTNVQTFNNQQFGEVRVVIINDAPWFVAVDVCRILEINNPRQALTRLEADEKAAVTLNDISSNSVIQGREMNIVNESGLYRLIFTSRKKEAKDFQRYIFHEVLPAIRKTGTYSVKPLSPLEILKQQVQIMEDQQRQLQEHEQQISQHTQDIKDIRKSQSIAVLHQGNINKDTRQRLEQHDSDIQTLKHKFEDPGPREELKTFVKQVYNLFKDTDQPSDYGHIYSTIYSDLEAVTHISLNARLSNFRKRLEEQGATKKKINSTTVIDVIEQDPNLWQPIRDILESYRQQIFK